MESNHTEGGDATIEELVDALQTALLCSRAFERELSGTQWSAEASRLHAATVRAAAAALKLHARCMRQRTDGQA